MFTKHVDHENLEVIGAKTFDLHSSTKRSEDGDLISEIVTLSPKGRPSNGRLRLPLPPINKEHPFAFGRFAVAPGEKAIVGDRKVGSGLNATFLLIAQEPLKYKLQSPFSLNRQVVQKFGYPPEMKEKQNEVEFVLFQLWLSPNEALLTCHYGERSSSIYYTVILNTANGSLHNHEKTTTDRVLTWPEKFESYPQTRLAALSDQEIAALSYAQVRYAINEMYVRRGYSFPKDKEIHDYFKKKGFEMDPTLSRDAIEQQMWPIETLNLKALAQHRERVRK